MNFEKEFDDSFFDSERVHVLSYNEYIIERITVRSFWVAIFALFVAVFAGFIPFYRDYGRQVSLLEALYAELNAISSKKSEIELIKKKIPTKGNLQWVKELLGWGLKGGHEIWRLNTRDYVVGLNRKIKGRKTKHLKDTLIHISQKIELIGNHLSQYDQIPQVRRKDVMHAIMKLIEETIELVEETKKFIKKEFRIKTPF
ncbi:hypothetical protein CMI37_19355 [Candidatus Pacearchaeota archaeon]|nr:hypothetical protein [Candidatus Pacearchaeota archaeon]|tara:strand:- start:642 stop:1241 length:600 start_codon:yes stop_codon:yes gene_type:complete